MKVWVAGLPGGGPCLPLTPLTYGNKRREENVSLFEAMRARPHRSPPCWPTTVRAVRVSCPAAVAVPWRPHRSRMGLRGAPSPAPPIQFAVHLPGVLAAHAEGGPKLVERGPGIRQRPEALHRVGAVAGAERPLELVSRRQAETVAPMANGARAQVQLRGHLAVGEGMGEAA